MAATPTGTARLAALIGLAFAAILLTAVPVGAQVERVEEVEGRASGIDASIDTPVGNIGVPPTPEVNLPSGGGSESDEVVGLNVPPAVGARVLSAATSGTTGDGGGAQSDASVTGANVGGGAITADVIEAHCASTAAGTTGDAGVVDGNLGGNPIEANPPPNSSGGVPGVASITANQQTFEDSPGSTRGEVTALAVVLQTAPAASGDVNISRAACGVLFGVGGANQGTPSDVLAARAAVAEAAAAQLARTGAWTGPLFLAGVALLTAGVTLHRAGQRRQSLSIV